MGEWIVFGISALLLVTGLFLMMSAVIGQYRFRYVLNRMHAASMGDSMGLGLSYLTVTATSIMVELNHWQTLPARQVSNSKTKRLL